MFLTGEKPDSGRPEAAIHPRATLGGSAAQPELDVAAVVWGRSIFLSVIAASEHSSGHRTPQLASRDQIWAGGSPPLPLALSGWPLFTSFRGQVIAGGGAVVGSPPESTNSLRVSTPVRARTHSREFRVCVETDFLCAETGVS